MWSFALVAAAAFKQNQTDELELSFLFINSFSTAQL
jgi:hypothetical protein